MRSDGVAIRDFGAVSDRGREAPDQEGDDHGGRGGGHHECRMVNGRDLRESGGSGKPRRDGEFDADSAWLGSRARRIFSQWADWAHEKRGDRLGV